MRSEVIASNMRSMAVLTLFIYNKALFIFNSLVLQIICITDLEMFSVNNHAKLIWMKLISVIANVRLLISLRIYPLFLLLSVTYKEFISCLKCMILSKVSPHNSHEKIEPTSRLLWRIHSSLVGKTVHHGVGLSYQLDELEQLEIKYFARSLNRTHDFTIITLFITDQYLDSEKAAGGRNGSILDEMLRDISSLFKF